MPKLDFNICIALFGLPCALDRREAEGGRDFEPQRAAMIGSFVARPQKWMIPGWFAPW
jgi:hypothetical protein